MKNRRQSESGGGWSSRTVGGTIPAMEATTESVSATLQSLYDVMNGNGTPAFQKLLNYLKKLTKEQIGQRVSDSEAAAQTVAAALCNPEHDAILSRIIQEAIVVNDQGEMKPLEPAMALFKAALLNIASANSATLEITARRLGQVLPPVIQSHLCNDMEFQAKLFAVLSQQEDILHDRVIAFSPICDHEMLETLFTVSLQRELSESQRVTMEMVNREMSLRGWVKDAYTQALSKIVRDVILSGSMLPEDLRQNGINLREAIPQRAVCRAVIDQWTSLCSTHDSTSHLYTIPTIYYQELKPSSLNHIRTELENSAKYYTLRPSVAALLVGGGDWSLVSTLPLSSNDRKAFAVALAARNYQSAVSRDILEDIYFALRTQTQHTRGESFAALDMDVLAMQTRAATATVPVWIHQENSHWEDNDMLISASYVSSVAEDYITDTSDRVSITMPSSLYGLRERELFYQTVNTLMREPSQQPQQRHAMGDIALLNEVPRSLQHAMSAAWIPIPRSRAPIQSRFRFRTIATIHNVAIDDVSRLSALVTLLSFHDSITSGAIPNVTKNIPPQTINTIRTSISTLQNTLEHHIDDHHLHQNELRSILDIIQETLQQLMLPPSDIILRDVYQSSASGGPMS